MFPTLEFRTIWLCGKHMLRKQILLLGNKNCFCLSQKHFCFPDTNSTFETWVSWKYMKTHESTWKWKIPDDREFRSFPSIKILKEILDMKTLKTALHVLSDETRQSLQELKLSESYTYRSKGPVAETGRRDWSPVEFTRWNESRGPVPWRVHTLGPVLKQDSSIYDVFIIKQDCHLVEMENYMGPVSQQDSSIYDVFNIKQDYHLVEMENYCYYYSYYCPRRDLAQRPKPEEASL